MFIPHIISTCISVPSIMSTCMFSPHMDDLCDLCPHACVLQAELTLKYSALLRLSAHQRTVEMHAALMEREGEGKGRGANVHTCSSNTCICACLSISTTYLYKTSVLWHTHADGIHMQVAYACRWYTDMQIALVCLISMRYVYMCKHG